MRVGWDMQAVTGPRPTGLGIAAGLLQHAVEKHAPEVEIVPLRPNLRNRALKGVLDRVVWEQMRLPRCIEKNSELDLLFSPALGVPMRCAVPKVAYVHDLIPLHYPQQFSGVAGWYWKELLPQTWRSCDALVVSNTTIADDLVRFISYPRERIFIVPYPLDDQYANLVLQREKREMPEHPYFLAVGTQEQRKNIEQSLRALALMVRQPQYASAGLHVIGMATPHSESLIKLANELGIAGSVQFMSDYVPKEQVVRELMGCTALLAMSRYEGFSLPPLEAMSIGCAVILSNTAVHRAVYGDLQRRTVTHGGPTLVRLDDPQALADEMIRHLEDFQLVQEQASWGIAYARTFTAESTAAGLLSAFDAVTHR